MVNKNQPPIVFIATLRSSLPWRQGSGGTGNAWEGE
jgi:hypothetical protein